MLSQQKTTGGQPHQHEARQPGIMTVPNLNAQEFGYIQQNDLSILMHWYFFPFYTHTQTHTPPSFEAKMYGSEFKKKTTHF